MFPFTSPVLVLVGPTAIGKTDLSLKLANMFNCEIISMDSMQVYKYMDIGTAKVTLEERQGIPHHLIDLVYPDESYDAKQFVDDALQKIVQITKRGGTPLITGGTGLYLKSLLEGMFDEISSFPHLRQNLQERFQREGAKVLHDELSLCDCSSALRIHLNDTHRLLRALEIYHGTGISWSEHIQKQEKNREKRFVNILQLGLTCDRTLLYDRINARTRIMFQHGLIDEVSSLLKQGYHKGLPSMQAIGYRHIVQFLEGNWTMEDAEKLLSRDTRRYAKRQYTWFKNKNLQWFEVCEPQPIFEKVNKWLEDTKC